MINPLEYTIALKHLKLENFRCFKELELDFDEKLTILIAENGGGKTAILEAIVEGLKAYLSALKVEGYQKSNLNSKSIRKDTFACDILLEVNASHLFPLTDLANDEDTTENGHADVGTAIIGKSDPDLWDSRTSDVELSVALRTSGGAFMPNESSAFYRDAANFGYTREIANLPVLAYYGGDSVAVSYDSKKQFSPTRLDLLYQEALTPSRFSFTPFYNWFKANEDKMFRIGNTEDEEYKTIENQLNKIKTAVAHILNDDENELVYTGLRIDKNLEMGMTKSQPGGGTQFIEISQFSAGEKSLFAFVADLGMRLLQARLDQDFAELEGFAQIRGKGIVLVDEVDLHLHPKWQQKVVGKLMEIFPDLQWVMTTHSPLVLASEVAGPQNAFLLTEEIENGTKVVLPLSDLGLHTNGVEPNRILQEIMSVTLRNAQTQKKINELTNLLIPENYEPEKVEQMLYALTQQLGENDPFIFRANHQYNILKRQLQKTKIKHEVH